MKKNRLLRLSRKRNSRRSRLKCKRKVPKGRTKSKSATTS